MLKFLEITGFKSFGKKTALDFATPITAIVGPNGSGKSNVAEAFQFVLGEQSLKSMRGKRGEDLIFNGGKSAARANRGSVKINFDNSKKILNLDFDEVSFERVVHRDGVNEYLINGSAVRLKDIVEILAVAHIGPSGHHIISQGEADRILNANIRERREIVEDALGLKIYQYKRSESERKLEKTELNIKEASSLKKEITPHLKFLEKQMEKLEKAEDLKKELTALYQTYFGAEAGYIKQQEKRIAEAKAAPEMKLKELEKELFEARAVISGTAKNKEVGQRIIMLEKQLQDTRIEMAELSRTIGRMEGEISWQEKSLEKEQAASKQSASQTIPLTELEDLKRRLDTEAEKAEGSDEVGMLKAVVRALRRMFEEFLAERRGVSNKKTIEELSIALKELRQKKSDAEQKLAYVGKQETELQNSMQAVQREVELKKEGTLQAEKSVFRIMAEKQESASMLSLLKSDEERLGIEEEDFKGELDEAAALLGRAGVTFTASVGADLEARGEQLDRRKMIERMKIRLEESGVTGGADVKKEFDEVSARNLFLGREITDLEKSADNLEMLIRELAEKIDTEFKKGVTKINTEFEKFFALMFGSGRASLQVVRPERRQRSEAEEILMAAEGVTLPNEAEEAETKEGIDIHVSLPHKKIKGLQMLSGGERALTSIALLFAMSQVNPPPFIILDETDAALDEANSRKFGDMIENLSKLSQLILITHNRETMSRAGVLYGVTMGGDGVSKLLSIAFDEAVNVAK